MSKVKPVQTAKGQTVNDLVKQLAAFNGGRLARGIDTAEKMIKDKDCTVLFSQAGALVPGGMRQILVDFIRDGWIDCFVTTGATLVHDLSESLGEQHEIVQNESDEELHKKGLNRVFDVAMPQSAYEKIEDWLYPILDELPQKEWSIREFIQELGSHVKDKNSIMRAAFEEKIPIFSPGFQDSGLGLMCWFWQQQKASNNLVVNAISDLGEPVNLVRDAKKSGVFIIGGGVPKNHIMQAAQFSEKGHTYGVQVVADRPEYGGLTGATLHEGISWGKFTEKSEFVDIFCDASIALPLISSALKDRLQ